MVWNVDVIATYLALMMFLSIPLLNALVLNDVTFNFSQPSEVLTTTSSGRIRGARDRRGKDFVLGGLFPIHTGGAACGEVRLERGLERMEAMLFAIDKINSDESLLQGLTLGYDIRDTCNSENIGLDETVDLVLTSSQLDIASCQSTQNLGVNETLKPPTSGIVGAAASRVSVPVASLVRLFTTPQVSYASSSAILSNRDRYEYFYRTIPPDNLQARAMIDVMLHFGWAYVSTIYSLNPYGEPGINEFQTLAAANGICIDRDVGISDDFSDAQFDALAQDLISSDANVVILFTSQDSAEKLLRFIADSAASRRFIWIASDAWARSINVVQQFNDTAAGLYGFSPLTEHLDDFQTYFSSLTLDSNLRNPWFEEFYMAVANCTTNETINPGLPPCDRNSNVTQLPSYQQGNFIPLVVDAVYTYAHALQDFFDSNCAEPFQWFPENRTCFGQTRELNGSTLLEYIQRVDFRSVTGNRVLFDSKGNVEGRYEIVNYQARPGRDGRNEYFFQRVGIWDSSVTNDSNQQALSLIDSAGLQFGVDEATNEVRLSVPLSQCGICEQGFHRREVQSSCCGFCEPCLGQQFSANPADSNCSLCGDETWGGNPLVGSNSCVKLDEAFLSASHPYSIIIVIIAIFGIVCVVFTAVVYVLYWTTPIVKSSGREQMMLLLVGITCSFISTFFYISPPVVAVCGLQRWLLWTSFSIMFGSLLVKITRVARIFLRKNTVSRPRFTEPQYQILFTSILVIIQWGILAISFGVQPPEVRRDLRFPDEPNDTPTVVVTCILDNIILLVLSVGYESMLIIICTILGVLSFSYPENFNEAKFVSFCSLAILVIWVAFIITFFATRTMQEFQNIAISLAVVMTGYAVLSSLFARKIFVILFQPKKNVTTKFSQHGTGDVNTVTLTGSAENRFSIALNSMHSTPTSGRKNHGTFIRKLATRDARIMVCSYVS